MAQKNHLKTHEYQEPTLPKQQTVVISIRVPKSMFSVLEIHAKNAGLDSPSNVLRGWIENYCLTTFADWKVNKKLPLTELEASVYDAFHGLYPKCESFAIAMSELEKKGLIVDAQQALTL